MTFSREELKARAKVVLKKYYWRLFLVSLILTLIGVHNTGSSNGRNSNSGQSSSNSISINNFTNMLSNPSLSPVTNRIPQPFFSGFLWGILALASFAVVLVGIFFALFISILVFFPLEVGCRKIFINTADGESMPEFGELKHGFTGGFYSNVVKAGFLRSLYTFLWTLLFIIPGIIKGLAYSMTPYLLAENPGIDANRALSLSDQITQGHKMEIFVMQLSFFGWYLLGALVFGVGLFFVHPYVDATMAQLYLSLRDDAISKNIIDPAELGITPVDMRYPQYPN